MNRLFAVCALTLLVLAIAVDTAYGETISWSNPTIYTDNTAIPVDLQAQLETRLFYGSTDSACQIATNPFVTTANGANSWTGVLPVTTKGSTTFYCATSRLLGAESGKSPSVSYTVPLVPPKNPASIVITK